MARVIKAPKPVPFGDAPVIFLAGSIDNGQAPDWQGQVERALAGFEVVLLNPRREDWDPTWEVSAANPGMQEQVKWELDAQERAGLIAMYFAPGSKSPVTMLELGLFARSGRLLVACPPDFWRQGNVELVCKRYRVPFFTTLEELIASLRAQLTFGTLSKRQNGGTS